MHTLNLQFPGGNVVAKLPTRAQLEQSASEWFDKGIEAFASAASAMASGAIEHAVSELAHAEHCAKRARADLAQARALPEKAS